MLQGLNREGLTFPVIAAAIGHAAVLGLIALFAGAAPLRLPTPEPKPVEVVFAPAPQPEPSPQETAVAPAPLPPPPEPEPPVAAVEPPPPSPPVKMVEPPPARLPQPEPPPKPAVRKPPPLPKPPPKIAERPPVEHRLPPPPLRPVEPYPSRIAPPAYAPQPVQTPQQTAAMPVPPAASAAPIVSAGYRGALSAWLESHKRYPDSARQRREEGRATLRFRIDRAGRVLNYALVSGTGYPDLDNSIEAMMRGATLPPFPPEMTQPEIDVSVTVRFSLTR